MIPQVPIQDTMEIRITAALEGGFVTAVLEAVAVAVWLVAAVTHRDNLGEVLIPCFDRRPSSG
jgi:hypothetical protein